MGKRGPKSISVIRIETKLDGSVVLVCRDGRRIMIRREGHYSGVAVQPPGIYDAPGDHRINVEQLPGQGSNAAF